MKWTYVSSTISHSNRVPADREAAAHFIRDAMSYLAVSDGFTMDNISTMMLLNAVGTLIVYGKEEL